MSYDLIEKAKTHSEDMKARYREEISASIKSSSIYGPEMPQFYKSPEVFTGTASLVKEDTVSCLFKYKTIGKIAVLNFASFKIPGGLYLKGSYAQEEALCHESTLYPVLTAFDEEYYGWNRKNLNKGLYRNRALYTPNIVFERGEQTIVADVINCAAPNLSCAKYKCGVPEEHNSIILKDRIRFMFKVADVNKVDTLIAGAWGCGVFMQNPYEVCSLMLDEFRKGNHSVTQLYLAVPGGENYEEFKECINSLL